MTPEPAPDDVEAVLRSGTDAVSFPALKAATRWWRDAPPPDGTGARIAYVPSGRTWIAIGSPVTDAGTRAEAVRRFSFAARAQGRRTAFFGVESLDAFAGCRTLTLGLQSVLKPAEWPATLRASAKLREQLRRARAKRVTVRRVEASDLGPGAALRQDVERLRREWLRSRAMEPMGFLVDVQPFYAGDAHRYFVAERDGRAVHFLSAVPIDGGRGWLMEDMLRGPGAPNGTTELVIDALMRTLPGDGHWVTPGLTPLAGPIPWWLACTRLVSVALYDFSGLRRFRARLKPADWRPIWLAWDRGPAPLVVFDVLRAFAGGRIGVFVWRSLVRHPNGPPWAVAVPLVAWTLVLTALAGSNAAASLGFSSASLRLWILFDAALAWLLFKVARRPRRRWLAAMTGAAGFDAIVSVRHLASAGLGATVFAATLRLVATLGPIVGTAAVSWAWWTATRKSGSATPAIPSPH